MRYEEAIETMEMGLERLGDLDPNRSPEFGIMTPTDMIRHLLGSIALTYYDKPIVLEIPEDKVPKAHAFLYSDHLIRPGATQPEFYHELSPTATADEFATWVSELRSEFALMKAYLNEAPDDWQQDHPKFGRLNKELWWLFQGKHFYHHMSQFGLFPRLEKWEGIPK